MHIQLLTGGTAEIDAETLEWRKHSNPSGNCVELARLEDGTIVVHNSNTPGGLGVCFTRAEIQSFFSGVQAGYFADLVA